MYGCFASGAATTESFKCRNALSLRCARPFSLYGGTSDVKAGTFLGVPVTTYGDQRDTYDKNQRYTIGAKQFFGESSISSEFTYQKSTNELYYSELDLATVLPRLTIDTSGKVPSALRSEGVV